MDFQLTYEQVKEKCGQTEDLDCMTYTLKSEKFVESFIATMGKIGWTALSLKNGPRPVVKMIRAPKK